MLNKNLTINLVKDIKDRIQFLVTTEIFFFAFTYAFFKTNGLDDLISNKNSLFWGIAISISIMSYLLSDGIKREKIAVWIYRTLFLNILFFSFSILLISLAINGPLPDYIGYVFLIAFNGAIYTPALTFLLVISASWR